MKVLTQKKGFTILETLVAIAILMLAVTGPLYFASNSLMSAVYARDQITAFYLAQEGFEQIRAVRDNNILNNDSWLTGIWSADDTSPCTVACEIDAFNDSKNLIPTKCPASGCEPLILGTEGKYSYKQGTGTTTSFVRTIQVTATTPDEAKVTVKMDWVTSGTSKTFTASEYFRNLKPTPTS